MYVERYDCKCIKCEEKFKVEQNETWWDYSGYGYSAKLTKCPYCNSVTVVYYKDEKNFDVNKDTRYYRK